MLCTYGTPQVGMARLTQVLRSGGFPIYQARNGADPITELPVPIGDWNYEHPVDQIPFHVKPTGGWHGLPADDPLSWHDMQLYLQGELDAVQARAPTALV